MRASLIRKPRVLFLDEPTAHFDVRSEAEFLERLKALGEAGEMTIIVSTHRLSLLSLVDRILVFDNGKLVADGPRDEVLAKLRPAAAVRGLERSQRERQCSTADFAFANDVRAAVELRTPRPRACCCSPSLGAARRRV